MSQGDARNRQHAFEARLASLRQRAEAGFARRAQALRGAATRLEGGDGSARDELKTLGHRLRGIAGTYGHGPLGELAGALERACRLGPEGEVTALARDLAVAIDRVAEGTSQASADDAGHHPGRTTAPAPARPTLPAAFRLNSTIPATRTRTAPRVTPAVPPSAVPRPSLPAAKPTGPTLRVLAVDDDPLTLRLLTLTLRQVGGFQATIVSSAREALTLLTEGLAGDRFDLVLSDAMMPDMNGLEFCAAARALDPRMARLPVVILSAATAEELGWRGQLDAHTTWVRKPFRPSTLVEQLARIAAGEGRAAGGGQ